MEPIYVRGCRGSIGNFNEGVYLKKYNNILYTDSGIFYSETDKSGIIIDCDNGYVVQGYYNGFVNFNEKIASHFGINTSSSNNDLEKWIINRIYTGETGASVSLARTNLSNTLGRIYVNNAIKVCSAKEWRTGKNDCDSVIIFESQDIEEELEYLSRDASISTVLFVGGVDRKTIYYNLSTKGKTPTQDFIEKTTQLQHIKKIGLITYGWLSNNDVRLLLEKRVATIYCLYEAAMTGRNGFFPLKEYYATNPMLLSIGSCNEFFLEKIVFSLYQQAVHLLLASRANYWTREFSLARILKTLYNGWIFANKEKILMEEGNYPDLYIISGKIGANEKEFLENGLPIVTSPYIKGVIINGKFYTTK